VAPVHGGQAKANPEASLVFWDSRREHVVQMMCFRPSLRRFWAERYCRIRARLEQSGSGAATARTGARGAAKAVGVEHDAPFG
jgi:hypothetical protein